MKDDAESSVEFLGMRHLKAVKIRWFADGK